MPNDRKFRELILHVCQRSEGDGGFGATKLNKLLFFIDIMCLRRTGNTVTGQEYQKLPYGPAPRRLKPVLNDMEREGDIRSTQVAVVDYAQHRTEALRPADTSVFSAAELDVVEDCIKAFRKMNANHISSLSHEFIGWKVVDDGDTIPLGAVFISNRRLTAEEKSFAHELV